MAQDDLANGLIGFLGSLLGLGILQFMTMADDKRGAKYAGWKDAVRRVQSNYRPGDPKN